MRASIASTLPFIRPRANRRRFALILKTLVDDSETSETLNPTEILHSISFVFVAATAILKISSDMQAKSFQKQQSLLLPYHSLHTVNSIRLIETFSRRFKTS
jgi:hypothetical protein